MRNSILSARTRSTGRALTATIEALERRVLEGHMANTRAMGKAGKLLLAGPFDPPAGDKTAYAGLFVLGVKSKEEAEASGDAG